MNTKVTEAKAALDEANTLYAPIFKASFRYTYDLTISRKANADRKAANAVAAEKAYQALTPLTRAWLAARQDAHMT